MRPLTAEEFFWVVIAGSAAIAFWYITVPVVAWLWYIGTKE